MIHISLFSDVNECTNGTDNCDANAQCTNTIGSFTCACDGGYSGNGTSCANINECDGAYDCDANATCRDTQGSYTCTCNQGFAGDGKNCSGAFSFFVSRLIG